MIATRVTMPVQYTRRASHDTLTSSVNSFLSSGRRG